MQDRKLLLANLILSISTLLCLAGLIGLFVWGLFFNWTATLGIAAGTIAISAFIWALLYSYEHGPMEWKEK